MKKILIGIGLMALGGSLNGCGIFFGGPEIWTCEDSLQISDCSGGSMPECVFTNTSKATFNLGHLDTWSYDAKNIQIGEPDNGFTTSLAPGKSIRGTIFRIRDGAKKVVLCSVDPQAPYLKGKLKLVK